MKVMAGDKVDVLGKSYFLNTATINNSNSTPLSILALMTSLLTAPANGIAAKGATAAQLTTLNTGQIPSSFIRGNNGETTTIPKAYINYILLDEQFKYVGGGASRVGSSGTVKDHWQTDAALQGIAVEKNGYIFVYVSNESNVDVFFDNLQVVHKPGPVLEETHYYPFGLTMAGISSKALSFGNLENKHKYQNYEFNNDFDINLYESFYRTHDPQIGRFLQIDPKPYEMVSPYAAMMNNPMLYSDPLGDTAKVGVYTQATFGANNKYNKQDVTNQLLNEWGKLTGLKLSLDADGNLVNGGVATNKGISKTARKDILDMIASNGTVYFDFSTSSSSSTTNDAASNTSAINLNPETIANTVAGTSKDLNKMTAGMGMTALHEMGHTFLNGNLAHSNAEMTQFGVIGSIDQRMNQVRSEMGANWGQRSSYTYLGVNGYNYTPMSSGSLKAMQKVLPLLQTGNTSNIVMPTTGVIKQKSSIIGQLIGFD